MENTAHRRKKGQVERKHFRRAVYPRSNYQHQEPYYGTIQNDILHAYGLTTDNVLWEYMCKVNKSLAYIGLLKIISEYDNRDRTINLRNSIKGLKERINGGKDRRMILKIVKKTLESKKRQLVEHQGSVPGTPET